MAADRMLNRDKHGGRAAPAGARPQARGQPALKFGWRAGVPRGRRWGAMHAQRPVLKRTWALSKPSAAAAGGAAPCSPGEWLPRARACPQPLMAASVRGGPARNPSGCPRATRHYHHEPPHPLDLRPSPPASDPAITLSSTAAAPWQQSRSGLSAPAARRCPCPRRPGAATAPVSADGSVGGRVGGPEAPATTPPRQRGLVWRPWAAQPLSDRLICQQQRCKLNGVAARQPPPAAAARPALDALCAHALLPFHLQIRHTWCWHPARARARSSGCTCGPAMMHTRCAAPSWSVAIPRPACAARLPSHLHDSSPMTSWSPGLHLPRLPSPLRCPRT